MADSTSPTSQQVHDTYALAKARYAMLGVDTDQALATPGQISLSLHCWQGDDVAGIENPNAALSGRIAAIGNYPGKARNADELRRDLDQVYHLIPGMHRLKSRLNGCPGLANYTDDELKAIWLFIQSLPAAASRVPVDEHSD